MAEVFDFPCTFNMLDKMLTYDITVLTVPMVLSVSVISMDPENTRVVAWYYAVA